MVNVHELVDLFFSVMFPFLDVGTA